MNLDDLTRSTFDRSKASLTAIDLQGTSEDELYRMLATAASAHPVQLGFQFDVDDLKRSADVDSAQRHEEWKAFGKRLLLRWSRALHDFVCTNADEDRDLKDKIRNALTAGAGSTAVLAAGITTAFGLAPAVAAIIAALLVRLIVAPAHEEVCSTWTEWLSKQPAT